MKKKNFSNIMNLMIILLLLMLVLIITVSMMSIIYIWRQTNRTVESTAEYYAQNLDQKFQEINGILSNLILSDTEVKIYAHQSKYDDDVSVFRSYVNIAASLTDIQKICGDNFGAFLYFEGKEEYIVSDRGTFSLQEWGDIRESIFKKIQQEENVKVKSMTVWLVEEIDGTYYAVNYFYYQGIYACAFSKLSGLTEQFDVLELGADTFAFFIQNDVMLSKDTAGYSELFYEDEGVRLLKNTKNKLKTKIFVQELRYADFQLCLVVENQSDIVNSLIVQAIIIMLFILTAGLAIIIFYLAKKRVMEPMQYFSENLVRVQENGEETYFESSDIKELEEANDLFKKTFGEMKKLKIEVYEHILEKQKVQLNYMQLQIQPHFYVNCLNLIYNMACIGEYEGIQEMTVSVSQYLRYVFRPSHESVSLDMEMKHIENYLSICKLRYSRDFSYEVHINGRTEDIILPPLVIQTFVENSIKYSVTLDTPVTILILIERIEIQNKELVTIQIEDTGAGFTSDVLEHLQKDIPFHTTDGTRIGIENTVKRLKMLYGEIGSIKFFNKEEGGAVVRICIPSRFPITDQKGS